MKDIQIIELSDKVIVIQGHTLLNDDGRRQAAALFEEHGFKVIWVCL